MTKEDSIPGEGTATDGNSGSGVEEDPGQEKMAPPEGGVADEVGSPETLAQAEEAMGEGASDGDAPEAVAIEDELYEGESLEGGTGAQDVGVDEAGVQVELRRLRDQHLRLAADFENFRKRAGTELAGNWVRARADLVRSLVEGLDDLQRVSCFTTEDTTVEALIEGVDLVERNILKALTDAGLVVLNPEGERFDPNIMEAMMRVPTEEDGLDETVHQVFLKGYMFKDQLVRPARVSVYKDDD